MYVYDWFLLLLAMWQQTNGTLERLLLSVLLHGGLIVVALVVIAAILAAVLVFYHMNKNESEWHDCFSREKDIQIQQLLVCASEVVIIIDHCYVVHTSVPVIHTCGPVQQLCSPQSEVHRLSKQRRHCELIINCKKHTYYYR